MGFVVSCCLGSCLIMTITCRILHVGYQPQRCTRCVIRVIKEHTNHSKDVQTCMCKGKVLSSFLGICEAPPLRSCLDRTIML